MKSSSISILKYLVEISPLLFLRDSEINLCILVYDGEEILNKSSLGWKITKITEEFGLALIIIFTCLYFQIYIHIFNRLFSISYQINYN